MDKMIRFHCTRRVSACKPTDHSELISGSIVAFEGFRAGQRSLRAQLSIFPVPLRFEERKHRPISGELGFARHVHCPPAKPPLRVALPELNRGFFDEHGQIPPKYLTVVTQVKVNVADLRTPDPINVDRRPHYLHDQAKLACKDPRCHRK